MPEAEVEVPVTNPEASTDAQTEIPEGTITVKVDGVDTEITLDEAAKGYMRQADYTRKTTHVANQQRELEPYVAIKESFDTDPNTAMRILGDFYGVTPPTPEQAAPPQGADMWNDEQSETPTLPPEVAAQVKALEAQVATLTNNQHQVVIDQASRDLADRHPDADVEAVRLHAQTNGFPSLETAYRDLHFEERNAAYVAAQAKAEAENAIIEDKRSTAGIVAPGSGTAVGSVEKAQNDGPMSFADRLRAEMSDAGFDPQRHGV